MEKRQPTARLKSRGYDYVGTTSDGVQVIRPPRRGRRNLSSAQVKEIVAGLVEARREKTGASPPANIPRFETLTPDERRILEFFTEGRSDLETSAALGVQPQTVEQDRLRAMEKLGAHDRTDLIRVLVGRDVAS